MSVLPADSHVTYDLQRRRCGKRNCHTCHGRYAAGHGPYWYGYWREGSRLRSAYIGKTRPAGRTIYETHQIARAESRFERAAEQEQKAS